MDVILKNLNFKVRCHWVAQAELELNGHDTIQPPQLVEHAPSFPAYTMYFKS